MYVFVYAYWDARCMAFIVIEEFSEDNRTYKKFYCLMNHEMHAFLIRPINAAWSF